MRERAMRGDYGWERPALEYLELYGAAHAAPLAAQGNL
jgi:glycogen synthase